MVAYVRSKIWEKNLLMLSEKSKILSECAEADTAMLYKV